MKQKLNAKLSLLVIVSTLLVLLLTACGQSDRVTLKVFNWGDYMDTSIIADFEKEYNIKVIYSTFATNEDMYVSLKSGGNSYDVAFPSDYMISRMINEDMLHTIDMNNIPNYKYIDDKFKNLPFDSNNEYSVPYLWGTLGIVYNKTMVDDPVDSWEILWNEKYSKQILMLDSQRDSIGITLKMLGYSMNTKEEDQLEEAKQKLIEQKPLVLAYVGDEVKDKMVGGEAALAVVWSGDAVAMKWENPDLEYVIPKEGSNLWFDSAVIPKSSKHKKEAEMFINYLSEPEVAFRNTDYIGYSTPNKETMGMLDQELIEDSTAYPSDAEIENCEVFEDLSDTLQIYDRIWTEIKSS
ncbi:MAG: spermidine/putrescine ABC transporter substrate-binding protein [Clostridiales bacterium]|nr:spermidine/putrescine ABC transporter substrate-binding protein [Clostridiales bacterium]